MLSVSWSVMMSRTALWLVIVILCGCQKLPPVVRILDQSTQRNLSELPQQVDKLVTSCVQDRWVTIRPCAGREFNIRCINKQFQIEIPLSREAIAALEPLAAEVAALERFRYSIGVPHVGSPFLSLHADDPGDDVGERALRVILRLLELKGSDPAWFQEQHISGAS
jgi:hypothetical protein